MTVVVHALDEMAHRIDGQWQTRCATCAWVSPWLHSRRDALRSHEIHATNHAHPETWSDDQ